MLIQPNMQLLYNLWGWEVELSHQWVTTCRCTAIHAGEGDGGGQCVGEDVDVDKVEDEAVLRSALKPTSE